MSNVNDSQELKMVDFTVKMKTRKAKADRSRQRRAARKQKRFY